MKVLVAALLLLLPLSWGIGAGESSWRELAALLTGRELSEASRTVLLDLRLPRLLTAFFTGGMLAAAGCASQNLFRNDLASPHVLGVVHASALGAVAGLLMGGHCITLWAILTGVAALLLLFLPGKRLGWDGAALILAGIAVNAFASALTSGALFLAEERLSSLVFWLLGGFWRSSWQDVLLLAPVALGGWIVLDRMAPEMDLLLLGDRTAALSGARLHWIKPVIMLTVAALTSCAVSCCGVIGFVGLAVPHMVRLFHGAAFRGLLHRSILGGGVLLLAADLAARTMAAPHEIPVGVLTALSGGPFFFFLLWRRGGGND